MWILQSRELPQFEPDAYFWGKLRLKKLVSKCSNSREFIAPSPYCRQTSKRHLPEKCDSVNVCRVQIKRDFKWKHEHYLSVAL